MTFDSQTLTEYAERAEQGDSDAQFSLGECYAKGQGVSQDYRKAAHYWLLAAKQNHAKAQMYLGTLFEKGVGVPHDVAKAAQCYQSAVNQDLAEAKVRLAMLYMQGQGVEQDHKKAIALFIQAANQGDTVAQYNLGIAYDKGLGGLTQNADQAFFWYHQASNQQHTQAMQKIQEPRFAEQLVSLGLDNLTVTQPTAQTDTQQDIAANNETHDSETLFEQGVQQLASDLPSAMQHFAQAAEQGHNKAQYNLGLACLYGLGGIEANGNKAIDWLKKSADSGFRPAYFLLGWVYQVGQVDGKGIVTPDPSLATGYYEMAGELGHAQAQYFLSKIYESGNGVVPNADTSLAWLRQSAKQGYNKAYYELEQLIP